VAITPAFRSPPRAPLRDEIEHVFSSENQQRTYPIATLRTAKELASRGAGKPLLGKRLPRGNERATTLRLEGGRNGVSRDRHTTCRRVG